MTPHHLLTRVSKLLENPSHWTKDALAKNTDGKSCTTDSAGAVRFSLAGAIDHVVATEDAYGLEGEAVRKLGEILAMRLGYALPPNPHEGTKLSLDLVMTFNDLADHAAVKALLREALERP